MKEKNVAILFGGKSHEHEISLCSAASVIQQVDKKRFNVIPIYIDKKGSWWRYDLQKMQYDSKKKAILLQKDAKPFLFSSMSVNSLPFDVVFPVVHGPVCEDGSLQGLFEILELPYVGANVLTSALAMDKAASKIMVANAGIAVAPFVLFSHSEWEVDKAHYIEQITSRLAPPFFVKPSNTGSSVGVLKVKTFDQLEAAIENAFTYHHKVIVEQGIVGREIEVSVLENIDPRQLPKVSLPGEVVVKDGFYSYEKKYLEPEEVELVMPAPLTSQETKAIQSTAIKSYQALQAESMARVDLFLESGTGNVYFNEMNTLPGFTPISMYPQLWQLSGLPYSELLTQLIELAIARQLRKAKLRTSYLSL